MTEKCRHLEQSNEAYSVEDNGSLTPTAGPMLCGFADNVPEKLVDLPRWLQRNSLSGHLLRYPDDCMGCPCFSAKQDAPK